MAIQEYDGNLNWLRTFCPEATELLLCRYIDGPGDWVIYFRAGDNPRLAYIERAGINWKLREEYIP